MTIISCGENPFMQDWDTPYGFPPFNKIENKHYLPAVKEGIARQKAEIQAIIDNKEEPTFENTIVAYELSGDLLSKTVGVLFNLAGTDNTPQMQKTVEEVLPLLSAHNDDIFMNPDFFARVKTVYQKYERLIKAMDDGLFAGEAPLDREKQMLLKKIYESFVRNGIDLDEANQQKMREINVKLSTLTQQFGNNVLAENKAFEDEFGISVSDYESEMTSCADRERREKMFKAYSSRGNNGGENDNKAIVKQIMKLRTEKAAIMGFNNSANFILEDKMAKNAETVDKFLLEIMEYAVKAANKDVAKLQGYMNKDIEAGNLPKNSKIEPWDWFYYAEKMRAAEYEMDDNQLKPYFKLDKVRDGAFRSAEKLYGIHAEKIEGLEVYHPQVEVFKMTDKKGQLLGIFLTDYRPRSVKQGGAWMNNFRDQFVNALGEDVRPIIINVGNLGKADSDEVYPLLNIDEVETVFHEFGHALHGLLTKCHYEDVSGTAVSRDFVELPSQFNENWAFRPDMLADYAYHYETGEMIPDSLVAKIGKASKFNQGFMTTELCAASILDMKWHELGIDTDWDAIDVDEFEKKVCEDMNLPKEIIPRYRSTYFGHIFNGGYNAGYYSYLWAEVLDKDAFEYFVEKDFAPEIATSFKVNILEQGGSEEPMTLYKRFRGQEPDPLALLRARGLVD